MAILTPAQTQLVQTGSALATVAYGTGAPPFGFVLLSDPATNIPIADLAIRNTTSGFSAQTYVNTSTQQIFIGIAGTNDLKDVAYGWPSAYLGWNSNAAQLQDALTYGKQLQDFIASRPEYAGYTVSSAGHSLGESFSQMYTYTFGWKGVGFDGVGAGSIINSAGYLNFAQSLNINIAQGTDFISLNTSGLGINIGGLSLFSGGGVGSTGFNIDGTIVGTINTSAGVALGGVSALFTLAGGWLLAPITKLFSSVVLHDMSAIINPAVQQGHFSVNGSVANISSNNVPFTYTDEFGNTVQTKLDAFGNVIEDGNGFAIFNATVLSNDGSYLQFDFNAQGTAVDVASSTTPTTGATTNTVNITPTTGSTLTSSSATSQNAATTNVNQGIAVADPAYTASFSDGTLNSTSYFAALSAATTTDSFSPGRNNYYTAVLPDGQLNIVPSILVSAGSNFAAGVPINQFAAPVAIGTSGQALYVPSSLFSSNSFSANSNNMVYVDPLILDLNGDGIQLTSFGERTVLFDIDHDQNASLEQTGWVKASNPNNPANSTVDGILVHDINGNGRIDGIQETLSQYYTGQAGSNGTDGTKPFNHGFEALKSLDSNNDNQFNSSDAAYTQLRVWLDANADGITDAGELKTLAELGITSINLASTNQSGLVNSGNEVRATGSFTQNVNASGQGVAVGTAGSTSIIIRNAQAIDFLANPAGSTFTTDTHGVIVNLEAANGGTAISSYSLSDTVGSTLDATILGVNNLYGNTGNDTLIGGATNNWLAGGAGSDTFNAGAGDDVLLIDSEDSTTNIHAGAGNDVVQVIGDIGAVLNLAQAEVEMAQGGRGDDILIGGGRSTVFIKGGAGDDIIIGGAANDVLSGEDGDDLIDGGASNDLIRGHRGQDQLLGGAGDDILDGGEDTDRLTGGAGNDVLIGGAGDDNLAGGAGNDVARFTGSFGDYRFVKTSAGMYVIDKLGRNGTDFLTDIEVLSFDDTNSIALTMPAPIAVDDTIKVAGRTIPITITAASLIANDVDLQKNDALSINAVSNAKGGTAVLNTTTGNITFTPTPGYTGVMSFMYSVKDVAGNVANVTFEGTGQTGTRKATVTLLTPDLPTDPLFTKQWYLNDTNVTSVWQDYTGKGVSIGQFEPGSDFSIGAEVFDYRHFDLKPNVDANWLSTALPPTTFSQHATLVAGVIVGARNGEGAVGVAYNASLAGYYLANNGSDLSKFGQFDVVNNSWSAETPFAAKFDQTFARGDYVNAVTFGRSTLGTVIVAAGGNSRQEGGNANYDNLINNRYSIQVGAINAPGDAGALVAGQKPFSNPGASILVSAPGSNVASTGRQLINENGSVFGNDFDTVMGTSFATPVVTGIIALMLEANPNLGYRDVQAILAMSAKSITDPNGTDWIVNGAKNWNGGGMHTSHDYGFGQVNALAAVRLAETWTRQSIAANEVSVSATSGSLNQAISDSAVVLSNTLNMAAGVVVEHAEVTVNLTHQQAGDLIIRLVSPNGTTSILANRPGKTPGSTATDTGDDTFNGSSTLNFTFMTTHDWGELSTGNWRLEVVDALTGEVGTLNSWGLQLFGRAQTSDDLYVFTDEYATVKAALATRGTLSDANGGKDTINAAAVTANAVINLTTGIATLGAATLTIQAPTNIENVMSGDGNDTLTGNALNNLLYAGRGTNGMTGGTGSDVFVVKARAGGTDTITDFTPTQNDAIILVGLTGKTFANLVITQVGTAVNINLGNNQNIVLQGRVVTDIKASQFLFQDTFVVPASYVDSSVNYATSITGSIINGDANNNTITGGAGNDVVSGLAGDDEIRAGAGNDLLDGGAGSDKLYGDAGDDTIYLDGDSSGLSLSGAGLSFTGGQSWGGAGNDKFVVRASVANSYSNIIGDFEATNVNERIDLSQTGIQSFADLTFGAITIYSTSMVTVNGMVNGSSVVLASLLGLTAASLSASNFIFASQPIVGSVVQPPAGSSGVIVNGNTLTGNAGGNLLDGGVGAQSMEGRTGDDTYVVDNTGDTVTELLGGGFDLIKTSVTYTLVDNVENLELTGNANVNGTGNANRNRIVGNAGNNLLDGGAGGDSMVGGAGDDTYVVDNSTDSITEAENAGNDSVQSAVTYVLSANLENLTLTGSQDINAAGNDLNNQLLGNIGNNRLDGGKGADTMSGGAGADTYFVDNVSDTVNESLNQGLDTVIASVNYTLTNDVEQLVLADVALQGTGNALDNTLIGNALANTLIGLDGNDTLNGGLGIDTLTGGLGDDTYVVDTTTDVITEAATAGAGVDTVQSSVTYTLGTTSNLENLTLTGSAAINATGNTLANVITGNSGNNAINGLAGNDTMIGGLGNDTYTIDVLTDVITENLNEGTDLVNVAVATAGGTYSLEANVENATLTNTVAFNLTGNTLNNVLTGNAVANVLMGGDGNDTLNGGVGLDTLIGGAGDDTYTIDVLTDVITENLNQGTDLVKVAIATAGGTYTLGANIENATINQTTLAYNLTGNVLDNVLTGNAVANTLTGGDGNDTLDGIGGVDALNGGLGDDVYVIDLTATNTLQDTIAAGVVGDGIDTINLRGGIAATLSTIVLASEIENLNASAALATALLNLTGNTSNNSLTGNGANNLLSGLEGDDTLSGLAGNDTLNGGAGNDTVDGGDGIDSLTASVNDGNDAYIGGAGADTYNLSAINVAATVNLALGTASSAQTGTDTLTGVEDVTGSSVADTLTGDNGANALRGLGGNDTIDGGAGADLLIGGAGADLINTGAANDDLQDIIRINAVADYGDIINNFDTDNALITLDDQIQIGDVLNTLFDDGTLDDNIAWVGGNGVDGGNFAVDLNTTIEALILGGANNEGVSFANLTNATAVAAEFNAEFALTAADGEATLLLINDTDSNSAAIWQWTQAGGGEMAAGELTLIGVVNANATITGGNFDFI